MKSPGTSYRRMILLMICSLLLLTGFLAYWLRSQHQGNWETLQSSLEEYYSRSREAMIDTLVLKHLVVPNMEDSMRIRIDISDGSRPAHFADSIEHEFKIRHIHGDSAPTRIMAIQMSDVHEDSCGTIPDPAWIPDMHDEELLVRSVKMFIDLSGDSLASFPGTPFFARRLDSTLFLEQYRSALKGRDSVFRVSLASGEGNGIVIGAGNDEAHLSQALPAIRVEGYGMVLFMELLPQLLFALVLLGLTIWALLFAARTLRKQIALNQLRDEFIANISHELKTPVSTVKVALEALGESVGPKGETVGPKGETVSGDYLQMAKRETGRLEKLVSRVMDHEALHNPAALMHMESCNLNELVKQACRTMDPAAREKGSGINVDLPESPAMVMADPDYLESVIINLLDNSLKYAGPSPGIEVLVRSGSLGSVLLVRDKGPGIPPAFENQVFERFFRVPTGNRHEVKGHGLGLSFVRQVMDKLGGTVSFANLPEGGCVFTLKFPPAGNPDPPDKQNQNKRHGPADQ